MIPCFPQHRKCDARSSLVKIHQLGLLVEINGVVHRSGALTDEQTHGRHTSAGTLHGVQTRHIVVICYALLKVNPVMGKYQIPIPP